MTLTRAAAFAMTIIAIFFTMACRPTGGPVPGPSTSTTALPDIIDTRCADAFGVPSSVPESQHRARPQLWPATPPFAVLCRLDPVSVDEEVGYYATSPGASFDEVTAYYEGAFTDGQHGHAPTEGGTILTGVIGDASYYVERLSLGAYVIVWAIDGNYSDEYVVG